MEIFGWLDFKNFINIGQTNHQCRAVIDSIFQKKIKDATVYISYTELNVYKAEYELRVDSDFDSILDFFRYFGHFITKMNFSYFRIIDKARYEVLNK